MTESAPFTQIQDLSTALASLVASAGPSVTAVQSHRSRSSGFVWRPGLIVTADEALSEDGEFAVTLSGGETVPAQLVGRDHSTDVALLRVDRSDLRPVPLEAAPVPIGALAIDLRLRRRAEGGVRTENSDSGVLVVKSAYQGMRHDATNRLNRARDRRIFVQ